MTVIGIGVTNMLFRASVFQRMGLFDETLDSSEDVDYVLRLREAGIKYKLEDEPAILHRRHETNMTNDFQKNQGNFIQALRKSIVRRRVEGFTQEFDDLFKTLKKGIKK
jgi:GT2 family glycosyltransferase